MYLHHNKVMMVRMETQVQVVEVVVPVVLGHKEYPLTLVVPVVLGHRLQLKVQLLKLMLVAEVVLDLEILVVLVVLVAAEMDLLATLMQI
jgi:hypothetical protein